MSAVRTIVGTGSAAISVILLVVGALYLAGGFVLTPHTIENGRAIDNSFSVASSWIDTFTQRTGRLPTQQEFTKWAASQPEQVYGVKNLKLIVSASEFPRQVIESFGRPSTGSYVLELWRGEWFEYFASWARASTVDSARGLYGSTVAIGALLIAIGLALWRLSKKCRPTERSSGRAASGAPLS